jgi:dTDP-4-dehydrorhamnose reductase
MRVLITGAGGQLGHELVSVFSSPSAGSAWEVFGLSHGELDVSDRDAVVGCITTLSPDVIVHGAAWTAVDACEGDPDRAFLVNSLGARWVADGARRVGAHVVYLSTDYVFDGTKETPYAEWDRTNPQSVYGRSKLGGELELDPGWAVARTSWVCGYHGSNMVKTILRLAASPGQMRFVDDQRGHPTFADDLARGLRELAVRRLPGVFHVTNQGAVSWFEFAQAVLEAVGDDPSRVSPISTADLDPPRAAPRPANSVLDNLALRGAGIDLLTDFREPLGRLVARLRAEA